MNASGNTQNPQETSPKTPFLRPELQEILHKNRPTDNKHPKMPPEKRAAEFAPFDALTGLSENLAITEKLNNAKFAPEKFKTYEEIDEDYPDYLFP